MQRHGARIHSHKNVTVLKSHWFDPDDGADLCIGIVLVKIQDGHIQAYIGTGKDHREEHGDNCRTNDEIYIAKWGAKISREMAESIFGSIDDWTDEED